MPSTTSTTKEFIQNAVNPVTAMAMQQTITTNEGGTKSK